MRNLKMNSLEVKSLRSIKVLESKPSDFLNNRDLLKTISDDIALRCDAYIIKNFYEIDFILKIKEYLHLVGTSSLPSYHSISEGSSDFHRIVNEYPGSAVKSICHQYLFHNWNQNQFDFFKVFEELFFLKNVLSGFEKNMFLKNRPSDDFVVRIAFQHYPVGGGYFSEHSDPVGAHQLVVPILQLSTKNDDYNEGGLYLVDGTGQQVPIDDVAQTGDLILFNGEVKHGVVPIDPYDRIDWSNKRGRWMCIISTIKTPSNKKTPDPLQIK
jgi:hypothetical protein